MNASLLAANLAAHWIQAGVLSLVALSAIRLLRMKDPRLALAVLHLLLLLIVLLPWIQQRQIRERPVVTVDATTAATVTFEVTDVAVTPASTSRTGKTFEPSSIALGVVAAGIVLRLGWLLFGFIRLRRFTRQTRSIEPSELAENMHALVGATATYLEHPTAGSPSTFGIFTPRIVLPARFASLSAAHQQSALCHELIHVKRHDVAAALAEEIVTAMLWFHPWVWVIRRRIRLLREQVVDRRVLSLTGDRPEYIRCLIEMSGHDLMPHLSQAGAAMVRSNELRARVDAIFQEVRMSRLRLVTISAVLAVVVAAAAWAASTRVPLYAMAPQTPATSALTLDPVERAAAAVSTVQESIDVRPRAAQTASRVEMIERYAEAVALSEDAHRQLAMARQAAQQAQPTAPTGQMRRLVKVAYAAYPSEALDKQISGIVRATITVNAAGEVTTADVLSGPVELRASAFTSLMGMKYSPGPDTARINIALDYRLDPQGWGVRVIQNSATIGSSITVMAPGAVRGELAANLGVPVRVGGNVEPPKKIKDMSPVYPQEAKDAGIQGVVILEAIIDAAGNVTDAKALRSIPLLDQAAIDAVKQWQYTPTSLNGVPVPVIMTVTVNFTLRKDIVLNIGLPGGAATILRIPSSGGMGIVELPSVGRFAFSPVSGASESQRVVGIYQISEAAEPPRLLGNVQVELNGGPVQSSTSPSFSVTLVSLP